MPSKTKQETGQGNAPVRAVVNQSNRAERLRKAAKANADRAKGIRPNAPDVCNCNDKGTGQYHLPYCPLYQPTGGSKASHVIKATKWLYRGYTIEFHYDTAHPYCYEIRDSKNATDTNAQIWVTKSFGGAKHKVDALIKGESIRNSRAYRKGEVTETERSIANGEVR